MTFLAPIAGLIGAAIGVPALVALYLLKLRRKPLKVSSVLLWEQAVQDLQANVPLRWLKWSWLLALQLVALGCLLAALARPAVPGTAGVAARTILVIDSSASMSARDGSRQTPDVPKTRLEQAKQNALALIEQMRRAPGVRAEGMVIAMAATARVVQGFTSDTRTLRDAVQGIQPTDQPANLDDVARIVGAAALAGADGESAGPRTSMVVFSDGSLPLTQERLPGSVDLRLVRAGPEPARDAAELPDNLGIVSIGARRDADNPAIARVFVRVINTSGNAIETTLSCTVDGEPAGLLPLTVPAATLSVDAANATAPPLPSTPGEASGTLELDRPSGGLVVVSIARPDLLDADNVAAVMLRPVSKPRILVVGANDPGDLYAQMRGVYGIDRFLLGVLQDLEPAEVRTIDIAAYREGSPTGAFAAYDLIVFDRVTPGTMPQTPTISIGANVPIPGLRVESAASGTQTRFISWKRSHPILKSAPLDAVLIAPPMRMIIESSPPPHMESGSQDAARSAAAPTITPLALGAGGPLIALVEEHSAVRPIKRLVLAFDLIRTNWGKDVSFPVFVSSAVDFLTGRGEAAAGRSFTTAEPISIPTAPGTTRIHVSGAETFDLEAPNDVVSGGSVSMGVSRLAGVYSCRGAAPGFETVAVNLADGNESSLGTRNAIAVGGRESRLGTEHAGEGPKREVWHWFVLAAAALLLVEWFVYAWRSRP